MFLRPFDLGSLVTAQGVRLYAKPDGINTAMPEHVVWCEMAAQPSRAWTTSTIS
jgi:hypothetical protein